MREDLKLDWITSQEDQYRISLRYIWTPTDNPRDYHNQMIHISRMYNKGLRLPWSVCRPKGLENKLCNKVTAFYWSQGAEQDGGPKGPVILGSIWNTWCEPLGRKPYIELDEFLAVPVRCGNTGLETISDILRAHKEECAQGHTRLEETIDVEIDSRYFKLNPIFV